MHRARLSFALLLALPLIACSKEPPPVPAPEPKAPAKAEVSAITTKLAAPPAATGDAVPAGSVEASASAAPSVVAKIIEPAVKGGDDAPVDRAKAKVPPEAPKAKAPASAAGGITLPATKTGVLGPGVADTILKTGSPPIVTLLDAGSEPRADLGYALSKGAAQKLAMGMDMTMGMRMGQKALPPTTIPHMVVLLDMHTTDQSAAGEWKIDSKLIDLTIEPKGASDKPIADAMRPQVAALKGLGIGYWVNSKGQVHDTKLDVPAGVPAAAQQMIQGMNQSFEAMVVPLPKEAVGTGARWQVVSRLSSSGADLMQSAIYTLRSHTGSKATIEVSLSQLAANGTIKVPGAPAGVSAQVKAFSSGGSGVQQLDINAVAPEGGAMQIKTSMTIVVQDAGAIEDTSIDTVTAVQMKRP